jgi:uncharacterized protein YbaR (Trm112 family)
MRKDLLAIVCCPVHKTALEAKIRREDEQGDILEGSLTCKRCDFAYPIEEGIPNLLPPEYHVGEVKPGKEAPPGRKGKRAE